MSTAPQPDPLTAVDATTAPAAPDVLTPSVPVSHSVLTAHSGIQIASPTQTVDVMVVWIRTAPGGVVFPIRIPDNAYSAAVAQALAATYTATIERWLQHPGIASISFTEDVNEAGDLSDSFVFTVVSTSGNSTRNVTLSSFYLLYETAVYPVTDAIRADLDTLEAG